MSRSGSGRGLRRRVISRVRLSKPPHVPSLLPGRGSWAQSVESAPGTAAARRTTDRSRLASPLLGSLPGGVSDPPGNVGGIVNAARRARGMSFGTPPGRSGIRFQLRTSAALGRWPTSPPPYVITPATPPAPSIERLGGEVERARFGPQSLGTQDGCFGLRIHSGSSPPGQSTDAGEDDLLSEFVGCFCVQAGECVAALLAEHVLGAVEAVGGADGGRVMLDPQRAGNNASRRNRLDRSGAEQQARPAPRTSSSTDHRQGERESAMAQPPLLREVIDIKETGLRLMASPRSHQPSDLRGSDGRSQIRRGPLGLETGGRRAQR
ncbi:hypothetical protein QFZ63_001733 [Streptomyces sp. B3I7]|nr:hypothetical protein [Streptomyces sp. B3I7]